MRWSSTSNAAMMVTNRAGSLLRAGFLHGGHERCVQREVFACRCVWSSPAAADDPSAVPAPAVAGELSRPVRFVGGESPRRTRSASVAGIAREAFGGRQGCRSLRHAREYKAARFAHLYRRGPAIDNDVVRSEREYVLDRGQSREFSPNSGPLVRSKGSVTTRMRSAARRSARSAGSSPTSPCRTSAAALGGCTSNVVPPAGKVMFSASCLAERSASAERSAPSSRAPCSHTETDSLNASEASSPSGQAVHSLPLRLGAGCRRQDRRARERIVVDPTYRLQVAIRTFFTLLANEAAVRETTES